MKKIIGSTGVDSGQLLITDPCYIQYKKTFKDDSLNIQDNELTCGGENYDIPKVLGRTLPPIESSNSELMYSRHRGMGVIVPTLHGDGRYDIQANYNKDGRISSITIKL
tara:strand:- start:371 stop:697 length:327 start_codon:yes stop_codon:yes gene_type:complete